MRGIYIFPAANGHRRRKVIEAADTENLTTVLRDLADLIGAGAFATSDGKKQCRFCKCAAACHADDPAAPDEKRTRATSRSRTRPARCSTPTGGCAAMSKPRKPPLDQPARDRLVTVFGRNVLVEAGAGSGKTHSLANRMAAGIASGVYTVDRMAAVTFTRKAAAELRGRFRLALEERLAQATSPDERRSLEKALTGIERLVAGTIHAFCARRLRERPIDAALAPGFVELDDLENLRRQRQAWRIVDYKSDRVDGKADVEAEMQARHGVQLGQYRFAWERMGERKVASGRIIALRALE